MTNSARLDPPLGGTFTFIDSMIPALVPSEQRVAREILEHPHEVAMMSAADVAARTGTSAATVIRACQSLGFKGFPHLRLLVLRDLPSRTDPVEHNAAHNQGATPREWLPSMFRSAGDELSKALAPLDFDEFDRAVAAMASAKRVLVVGNGASAPIAQLAMLGFLNSSRPSEAPADAVVQQLSARSLGKGDVCICISGTGTNSVTLTSAEAASGTGATVIGVTDYQKSRLGELSDVILVCGGSISNWSKGLITGSVAHVLLFAALQLAISAAAGLPPTHAGVMDGAMALVGRDRGTAEQTDLTTD